MGFVIQYSLWMLQRVEVKDRVNSVALLRVSRYPADDVNVKQSKNVESSAYAFDSARIQIPLGLRQPRAHSIQGAFDSHIVSQNTPKF